MEKINGATQKGLEVNALKDLAEILGYASEEDFKKELGNSYAMKTLCRSPIDVQGNSALNYALEHNDHQFAGILRLFDGIETNLEFINSIKIG